MCAPVERALCAARSRWIASESPALTPAPTQAGRTQLVSPGLAGGRRARAAQLDVQSKSRPFGCQCGVQ
eukprot:1263208-Alexandrium_andersonii.AAC.1